MADVSGEPPVEIMGSEGPVTIADLYDEATGSYFGPGPAEEDKPTLKAFYLRSPGATEERFDAVWPRIWELTETVHDERQIMAILDTGVLSGHPLLADCIRDVVDFTGEGPEDRAGHGTLVSLIARMGFPGVPRRKFLILKCVGADGRGAQDSLIRALNWMREFNARGGDRIRIANISLGVYNKRLGLFDCDGSCKVCKAAVTASEEILLSVAAGNTAGKTACPAKAAFLPSSPAIVAIGRPDERTSGRGTMSATPGSRMRIVAQRRSDPPL